jgi:hypothetical protein
VLSGIHAAELRGDPNLAAAAAAASGLSPSAILGIFSW